MRVFAICAVLVGCGRPDGAPPPRAPAGAAATTVAPAVSGDPAASAGSDAPAAIALERPGPRLAEGAAPIAYDLTLELDPDRAAFAGHVAIAIAITAPGVTRLWLHAADLGIARAALRGPGGDEPVGLIDGGGEFQLQGFALPHPVGPGTITLVIDYTGRVADPSSHAGKDEEGLFRERAGGRWYLYSQSESVFARKLVPCFDEPRFKSAWRVAAIVPRGQVALGNAAAAAERDLPDGRREVRFAEVAGLPSYLLAVAVGPFALVDAGRLGRARIPVRIAVAAGDGKRVASVLRDLPRLIDALEGYTDLPLPLAKLDLVAVPEFFGAMENPGLILFAAQILVGGGDFLGVAAHELAHQWFGDSVTPAWWEHLWLSEAFASWLGERATVALGAPRLAALHHRARLQALEADDEIGVQALLHPITTSGEIEPAFDTIAYDKGAAVLAMFESFVGPDVFQAAVRRYLIGNAGRSVTSRAFLDALAAASSQAVSDALASNLAYAGTPVVELALRCDAAPAIVASASGGVTVPVCLRLARPGGSERLCLLAGARTEQPLPAAAGCPAWLVGNDHGVGYYRTVWRGAVPAAPPPEALDPEDWLVRGDDAAIAAQRGELPAAVALVEIAQLAATHDPHGVVAALEIAGAIDPMVEDPVRPAWTAWLAGRFADRLTRNALLDPRSSTDHVSRRAIVDLAAAAIDPITAAAARAEALRRGPLRDRIALRIAAARDGGALFDRLIRAAASARTDEARDEALEALGELPAGFAPRVVDALLDPRFSADRVWPALAAMLARGDTRSAAWRAIHARFGKLVTALTGPRARDALAAIAALCDAGARDALAADAAPYLEAITDGHRVIDHTLAVIDRCVARRAASGDLAAALAAAPVPRATVRSARPASGL